MHVHVHAHAHAHVHGAYACACACTCHVHVFIDARAPAHRTADRPLTCAYRFPRAPAVVMVHACRQAETSQGMATGRTATHARFLRTILTVRTDGAGKLAPGGPLLYLRRTRTSLGRHVRAAHLAAPGPVRGITSAPCHPRPCAGDHQRTLPPLALWG